MSEACPICGHSDSVKIHTAREMMFGTRDRFEYAECASCGTLRLLNVPDLTAYYPNDYYSLQTGTPHFFDKLKRRIAARMIGRYLVTGRGKAASFLARTRPSITDKFPTWLLGHPEPIGFDSSILDYGCGKGDLLRTLSAFGFRNLIGADANIREDLHFPNIKVYKRSLVELDTKYDLIMLHHSFEHFPDPEESLRQIQRLLSADGRALIRIPVVNYAWERYGVDWVQLDPPRHLFLYTERAFKLLAERTGFAVMKIIYDSEAFQFYGSEQYALDIPMNDTRSFRGISDDSIFTQVQYDDWTNMATKLNTEGRGDQACFYLKRIREADN